MFARKSCVMYIHSPPGKCYIHCADVYTHQGSITYKSGTLMLLLHVVGQRVGCGVQGLQEDIGLVRARWVGVGDMMS